MPLRPALLMFNREPESAASPCRGGADPRPPLPGSPRRGRSNAALPRRDIFSLEVMLK